MKIIITMAGDGSRFKSAGFDLPKPCLSVHGRTLFDWALESLRGFFGFHFVFVARREHELSSFIKNSCEALGINSHSIVELNRLTSGQAETALLGAQAACQPNDAIGIYNVDTYVAGKVFNPNDIQGDGWIPVFKAEGPQWSFVVADQDMTVTDVAEKRRISNLATLGFYYFSSVSLFEHAYRCCTNTDLPERYVAPMYATLIADPRYTVKAFQVPSSAVHVLGTPEEVQHFQVTAIPLSI